MRRTALVLVATSTACFPFEVPKRPTYDAACVPSDPAFVELAKSERDLFPISKISADPEIALAQALEEAKRRKITIRKKKDTEINQWDGFSTTLPGVILVEQDWDEKPPKEQAWRMWHELVHDEQYDRMAPQRFMAWYAVPEGRWSLEVPPYLLLFRLQLHFGEKPNVVSDRIAETAVALRKNYMLEQMPECTVDTTIEIWLDGVGM